MAATTEGPPRAAQIAALRRHLARGGTFEAAAKLLKRPLTTVYRLAEKQGMRHRRRGLTPGKRRKLQSILRAGETPYQAALKTPVSTRTAWAYAHLQGLRTLSQRANTPRPCRPWRCPIGGELLVVTICIAHGTRRPPKAASPRGAEKGKRPFGRS